jgi:hypothetical protein
MPTRLLVVAVVV